MTTGKTIALTRQTFVDKVMSLLFIIIVHNNSAQLKSISIIIFLMDEQTGTQKCSLMPDPKLKSNWAW